MVDIPNIMSMDNDDMMGGLDYGQLSPIGGDVLDADMPLFANVASTTVVTMRTQNNEEMNFKRLELDQRCLHVLDSMSKGEQSWKDIQWYKKRLLLKKSTKDKGIPTLLHILARDHKTKYYKYRQEFLKQVIKHLLDHMDKKPPGRKTQWNEDGIMEGEGEEEDDDDDYYDDEDEDEDIEDDNQPAEPILKLAYMNNDTTFIDMIKECRLDRFRQLMCDQDDQQRNFLHYMYYFPRVIKKSKGPEEVRRSTQIMVRRYLNDAPPSALVAQDRDGNTPIHYAADYRQLCGRTEWYAHIFRSMVLRADKATKANGGGRGGGVGMNTLNESPILYYERTKKEYNKQQQENLEKDQLKKLRQQKRELKQKQEEELRRQKYKRRQQPTEGKDDLMTTSMMETSMEKDELRYFEYNLASREKNSGPGEPEMPRNRDMDDVQRGPPIRVPTWHTNQSANKDSRVEENRRAKTSRWDDEWELPETASIETVLGDGERGGKRERGSERGSERGREREREKEREQEREKETVELGGGDGNDDGKEKESSSSQSLTKTDMAEEEEAGKAAPKEDNMHQTAEEVLEFLTLHYIRELPDLRARELIYGKYASDRNLYFDAGSLQYKTTADIIELLRYMSVGGFGNVLAYVYFPTIQHTKEEEHPKTALDKKPTKTYQYAMNKGVPRQPPQAPPSLPENPNIGRSCLLRVFRLLYAKGVRKILRLTVDDMESPSHTDAAIEECLRGRHSLVEKAKTEKAISVETWDWRKPDLSTQVIGFAAPSVQHVHLYWSGNQTVLHGWSGPDGIPELYNTTNKKLKKVTMDVSPGIETRDRMEKMLSQFKHDVDKSTDGNVDIKFHYRMTGLSKAQNQDARRGRGDMTEVPQQHNWIAQMEEFRAALMGLHRELDKIPQFIQPERIKVALIDDGVNLGELYRFNGIVEARGMSFCDRPDTNFERPWYESTSGHGTVMANMIVRVNPWAILYVMKIEDGYNKTGARTIYAESASKAIMDAVGRKIDVISMSWTVRDKIEEAIGLATATGTTKGTSMTTMISSTGAAGTSTVDDLANGTNKTPNSTKTNQNDVAIRKLEVAIEAAEKAGILMFCSASDDIRSSSLETLPYRKAPNSILRIGAALAYGQRDAVTEDVRNIDFFFPGNQVADAWNPRSAPSSAANSSSQGIHIRYHDGSSVATALAAGLASLILHCTGLVRSYLQTKNGPGFDFDRFYASINDLKQYHGMKRAFQNIVSEDWEDKKYLPVWALFGPTARDINSCKGEKKLDPLDQLVKELCDKVGKAKK